MHKSCIRPQPQQAERSYCNDGDSLIPDELRGDHDVLVPQEVAAALGIVWVQGPCKVLEPLARRARGYSIPHLQSG